MRERFHTGTRARELALGILLRQSRTRTMLQSTFPNQQLQEPALQQLGVEPSGLGPEMLPAIPRTRGRFFFRARVPLTPRASSRAQPEAVAAGFAGKRQIR